MSKNPKFVLFWRCCITLMIRLIFGKRTLPITWLVVKGCKGHLWETIRLALLAQVQAILPEKCIKWTPLPSFLGRCRGWSFLRMIPFLYGKLNPPAFSAEYRFFGAVSVKIGGVFHSRRRKT